MMLLECWIQPYLNLSIYHGLFGYYGPVCPLPTLFIYLFIFFLIREVKFKSNVNQIPAIFLSFLCVSSGWDQATLQQTGIPKTIRIDWGVEKNTPSATPLNPSLLYLRGTAIQAPWRTESVSNKSPPRPAETLQRQLKFRDNKQH